MLVHIFKRMTNSSILISIIDSSLLDDACMNLLGKFLVISSNDALLNTIHLTIYNQFLVTVKEQTRLESTG